jgi:excisionase family DNA binding protein
MTADPAVRTESPPEFIDAEEAARVLSLGVRTIWRMTAKGRLPQPLRLSRKLVRWHRETLLAHMRRLGGCPPVEAAPAIVGPPVEAVALPTRPPAVGAPAVEDDPEERRPAPQSGALRRAVAKRVRLASPHSREAGLAKAFAALEALTAAAGLLSIADLFTEPIAALWDALPATDE